MAASLAARKWEVIARMNLALMRLAHVSYFPRTLTIAESLLLRAVMQHAFVWQMEGHPATVSKLARALGLSRATARRKLTELITYGYLEQSGRKYLCSGGMDRLQQGQALFDRYTAVIAHTCEALSLFDAINKRSKVTKAAGIPLTLS